MHRKVYLKHSSGAWTGRSDTYLKSLPRLGSQLANACGEGRVLTTTEGTRAGAKSFTNLHRNCTGPRILAEPNPSHDGKDYPLTR